MIKWRKITAALGAVALSAVCLTTTRAATHRAHLSLDLLKHEAKHSTVRTRVIVHSGSVDASSLAARHHLQIVNVLSDGVVVLANSDEITDLAGDFDSVGLSGDLPIRTSLSVSNQSTAADQVRAGYSGLFGIGSIPGVNGQGIGVAVIDSGVTPHAAIKNRIIANVSLVTGDSSYLDAYGHGTHVAGIIAGVPTSVTPLYTSGIAPGANIINVRVLGANGVGYTSDVINGIDWAVSHAAQYNIRVINLSLGHPVTEPAAADPLDQAVARAVQAGLIVVAAAGNYGVDPTTGAPILGGIAVPGNSPLAITVGAVNTWGTASRSDDTIATYSSRGPTEYDLAVKPDLAAPGNKIVSLEAQNSYLSTHYPSLHVAGSANNAYFQLSGTSMATPMVSGAVALLLQGNPNLSGAQVKTALQMGATYMPSAGLMGGGAGNANFWASRKLAASGLSSLAVSIIGGIATQSSGAAYWDLGGQINTNDGLANRLWNGIGTRLLSPLQMVLFWLNLSPTYGTLNLAGLLNPLAAIAPNPLLWGEVSNWTGVQDGDQVIWGSQIQNPSGQQVIWGSDDLGGDQVIWGSTTLTDPNAQ